MVLKGRYHDGDVKCDSDGKNCHGFLQATYAHDYAGFTSMYLRRYQNDRDSPATIIGNADAEGAAFLQHAHDRVVHYHKYVGGGLDDRYTPFQVRNLEKDTSPPEFAVVASWNIATPGAGAGWHSWTNLDRTEIALDPRGTHAESASPAVGQLANAASPRHGPFGSGLLRRHRRARGRLGTCADASEVGAFLSLTSGSASTVSTWSTRPSRSCRGGRRARCSRRTPCSTPTLASATRGARVTWRRS